jgi:hypothetical protein
MKPPQFSVTGALAGALGGWLAEVAIQEVTGHHVTTGLLELIGATVGLLRLDRRLLEALQDTLNRTQAGPEADYQQVRQRIDELTHDLPELRDILQNLVDAGIQAQQA